MAATAHIQVPVVWENRSLIIGLSACCARFQPGPVGPNPNARRGRLSGKLAESAEVRAGHFSRAHASLRPAHSHATAFQNRQERRLVTPRCDTTLGKHFLIELGILHS